jgi:hypothetical protein
VSHFILSFTQPPDMRLINLDVIRKHVVARERLREIVCRNPSRAGNPFCEFLILTSLKVFADLRADT